MHDLEELKRLKSQEIFDVFGGISLNNDYLEYYRSYMEINTYGVTAVHTQSGSFISQQKFARMHFNAGVN